MEDNKRLRIVVNFKQTDEDIELYNALKKHSSLSGYIKDILRGVISIDNCRSKEEIKIVPKVENEIDNDILDILGE